MIDFRYIKTVNPGSIVYYTYNDISIESFKKLIDKLYTFNFEVIDEDILGEAYEEVIKDVMTGKVLGQFFTPPKVKQMMIKLIKSEQRTIGLEKPRLPALLKA